MPVTPSFVECLLLVWPFGCERINLRRQQGILVTRKITLHSHPSHKFEDPTTLQNATMNKLLKFFAITAVIAVALAANTQVRRTGRPIY